jgi:dTDP-4-amino-4,6-dideoxygalactose transaminase
MNSLNAFDKISHFEKELAAFTGAPYAIMTDCCTHAIEMCLRYDNVKQCTFTPYTYISVPMTMHKLGIKYEYYPDTLSHRQHWVGEYKFELTRIWDSARRLEENMYRPGMMQCLSFGHDKPLHIGRGGAILLDDTQAYETLIRIRYDGRDLNIRPWTEQKTFKAGYHYKPVPEEAELGLALLNGIKENKPAPKYVGYADLRQFTITD